VAVSSGAMKGRIVITGSVASDVLMSYPGLFSEQFVGDGVGISLSFLVADQVVRAGGTAANIAYGCALLGDKPELAAAAGVTMSRLRTRYRS